VKFPSIILRITLWTIAALGLFSITPLTLSYWQYDGGKWYQKNASEVNSIDSLLVNAQSADLDGDGHMECVMLSSDRAKITNCDNQVLWQSPTGWLVKQVFISDLNRDDEPEASLLVWRPFSSWPIDNFLPFGGRIKNFHNQQGLSCHLILIGWNGKSYVEIWAGSALIRPVEQLYAVDLDSDGEQELVGLAGEYDSPMPGGTLTIWRWRGFGFVLEDETDCWFETIRITQDDESYIVFAQ